MTRIHPPRPVGSQPREPCELGRCNGRVRQGTRMCTTRAAAAVVALGLAACGGAASNGPAAGSGGCGATAVHNGPRPAWTDSAWADSSPGFRVPYALASGDRAAAFFFADPIRAGHPTNPYNKILWVMRLPRRGMPLAISARRLGGGAPTVSISRSADSSPGEIYPSYVDLPRAGCWRLALAWAGHHASIDVRVAPARGASAPAAGRPQRARARSRPGCGPGRGCRPRFTECPWPAAPGCDCWCRPTRRSCSTSTPGRSRGSPGSTCASLS